MKWRAIGKLFGFDVMVSATSDRYLIRIEATERVAALLFALGVLFRYVGPAEDSGRAWYQFEYSPVVDDAMLTLVEFAASVREHQPGFGQLELVP